jgi:hypothetical protein
LIQVLDKSRNAE